MSDPSTDTASTAPTSTKAVIASLFMTPSFAVFMIVTMVLVMMIIIMTRGGVPVDYKDLYNSALGAVIGAWIASVQYFIGSSSGSKAKSDVINSTLPGATP